MKLFDLRADFSTCCTLRFRRGEDTRVWGDDWFEGSPRGNAYSIPKGERGEERVEGPLPDFTEFALRPIPTFSERAMESLGDLLSRHGEFAAIEVAEPMRYFAFNATTIVNVLDEERSQIARFRSGGVMAVDRHVLLESVTSLPPIFKMPQTRVGQTYVNEQFVAEALRHQLSGFRFDLLFQK
jgi:hypothetical protein